MRQVITVSESLHIQAGKLVLMARLKAEERLRGGLAFLLMDVSLRLFAVVPLLFLWRGIFASGSASDLGLTLEQLLSYTLLSAILREQLLVQTPASEWLYQGLFLSLYQRPMGVFTQIVALTVGGWMPNLLLCSLPMALVGPLFGIRTLPVNSLFALSLLLSITVGFAIDLMFACLLIRMQRMSWIVTSIRRAVMTFFSGSLIPFAAFPWGIGDWMQYSPFGALAGAPLAIAVGSSQSKVLILSQLLWCIVLWPSLFHVFKHTRNQMMSYGG
ncbi:MAG: hypothetical protein FWE76_01330 [Symbiobacteriaceae bacterium]|nr:hypothetical protein [Symbiobacteriaceae bacterium]